MKKIFMIVLSLCLSLGIISCQNEISTDTMTPTVSTNTDVSIQVTEEPKDTDDLSMEETLKEEVSTEEVSTDEASTDEAENIEKEENSTEETLETDVVNSFDFGSIPPYEGSPYVMVNGNIPFFKEEEISTTSFENYSDLDNLDRCGVCTACIGIDLMPTEERGYIGDVKPSGWHTVKYNEYIRDNYLYNRCHLIGYQLSGENANVKNLITGTRYMNVEGMLPFENMVDDYVDETNNHVMYRVTPIFEGDNLVASGVLMEAKSVEDNGFGLMFNVYCYNVQPNIEIDYLTGESKVAQGAVKIQEVAPSREPESTIKPEPSKEPSPQVQVENEKAYAVNMRNGKIHIVGACSATGEGEGAMRRPAYFSTYEEAEAYSIQIAPDQNKRKCGNCW